MQVILIEDVKSLGKKGEIVKVSDGYANNFILKKNLGLEATPKNLNDLKLQKAAEVKRAQEEYEAAQAYAEELATKKIVLSIKVGKNGRTFGSVSGKEIVEEMMTTTKSERTTRVIDFDQEASMEQKKREGYF